MPNSKADGKEREEIEVEWTATPKSGITTISFSDLNVRNEKEWLKEEYSKLIANPDKVYRQNPTIIQAAHSAMQSYSSQETAELTKQNLAQKELIGIIGEALNKIYKGGTSEWMGERLHDLAMAKIAQEALTAYNNFIKPQKG